jgi:hypothetical protein
VRGVRAPVHALNLNWGAIVIGRKRRVINVCGGDERSERRQDCEREHRGGGGEQSLCQDSEARGRADGACVIST